MHVRGNQWQNGGVRLLNRCSYISKYASLCVCVVMATLRVMTRWIIMPVAVTKAWECVALMTQHRVCDVVIEVEVAVMAMVFAAAVMRQDEAQY